jgi:ABC-2 type transport system ATP-binding protein
MALIEVESLSKVFTSYRRREGVLGSFADLFHRHYQTITAVDNISFQINQGELIGYIGPNGAGKSTTIKMLTGILVPTGGTLRVDQFVPYRQRKEYTRNIGVVFGQRTQLWWDIAVIESFKLLRKVYRVSKKDFADRMEKFTDMLDLEPLLNMPVRKLSLGQRMRCDLVASLLHHPRVLFLDEPTIGLDVIGRLRIREFLGQINREMGTTMILTTHDLAEIEQLCRRVMIIDHGHILYDGNLDQLRERFSTRRRMVFQLNEPCAETTAVRMNHSGGKVEWTTLDDSRLQAAFRRGEVNPADIVNQVLQHAAIHDVAVQEPTIEEIVGRIYSSGMDNLSHPESELS